MAVEYGCHDRRRKGALVSAENGVTDDRARAMTLTSVGCTGSMSGPESPASCYLLQTEGIDPQTGTKRMWSVVLDMGPGSFGQLCQYIDPLDIDALIISHCHADHLADIVSLQVYRRWGPGKGGAPLYVAGPVDLPVRIRQIDGYDTGDGLDVFSCHQLVDGQPFTIGPMTITPSTARHPIPSFGIRVASSSASFFYTGDTDYCSSIVEGARDVDVLLSEAGFPDSEMVEGIHLSGKRAGMLASQAKVGALILTHIQPWVEERVIVEEARTQWKGPLCTAHTGGVYEIPQG